MKYWKSGELQAAIGRVNDGKGQQDGFQVIVAERVRRFHHTFPDYTATPLVSLPELAKVFGVKSIHVKDESRRFGLNAFKVLGGSYCIGNLVTKKLGMDMNDMSFEYLISEEVQEKLGKLTFITATDGNHGRGIAWTANRLGQGCVVLMPKGSAPERLENIRALGAEAWITDVNYDDTVRLARNLAEKNGWVLVQDTAWDGYEEIPTWIMQGYMTMGSEIAEQLDDIAPTHIFLQAGVGAMAGAMTGFFADCYDKKNPPVITIVEPDKADCFYKTVQADDGQLHAVTGDLDSIMAGLCCGEACTIAWDILKSRADCYVSMQDCVAARGMRMLGNPVGEDARIISGESGASAFGLAAALLLQPELEELKQLLGMDENSRILCISTEGATDLEGYRRIVWDGWYPNK